jgi:hypothetical protein
MTFHSENLSEQLENAISHPSPSTLSNRLQPALPANRTPHFVPDFSQD